jgi:hypothetical protein
MVVNGVVTDFRGTPVPGVRVQLFHPDLGPSAPTWTNAGGFYFVPNVPMNVRSFYVIEVYWDQSIVYRNFVERPGFQPPIVLK